MYDLHSIQVVCFISDGLSILHGSNSILGHAVNGFGKVLDVAGRNTSHGNTAVASQVDMPVFLELIDLFRRKSRVAEHTNLNQMCQKR